VPGRMHDGEVAIDGRLVRQLIRSQFPEFGDLDLRRFDSVGTVNAIYRLGDHLAVRLPRHSAWAGGLLTELRWLDELRPHLPLKIPVPVGRGEPEFGYPFVWAVYRWIPGSRYRPSSGAGEIGAARTLAHFVRTLRLIDAADAPMAGRARLHSLDVATRHAIEVIGGPDASRYVRVWERSLEAPEWEGTPVWHHGDLLPSNLLTSAGRLQAVVDFGSAGVGDPAADIIPAWTVFGARGRGVFRDVLEVDDPTWERARGLALHQALLIVPYYARTNPAFASLATRTLEEVLNEGDR